MDAGLSLFLACIAVISFGLLWFRVRDAVTDLLAYWTPDHSVKLSGSEGGTQNASFAGTYQPEPPSEPLTNSTGTRADLAIKVLAGLVEDDGSYTYSANKIAEFVGGTRTETLAKIRAARGLPDPAQPAKRTIPLRRNGQEELLEVDW